MGERPSVGFADRLAALVEERRSQIVLGLDPDPSALWRDAVGAEPAQPGAPGGPDAASLTAAAVERHCRMAIDAAGAACVAVKPQLACFERLGAPGWAALAATVQAAQQAGLLVIADGKRGDVPVTAKAYAQALVGETPGPYGPVRGLGADAFTANPLLGRDALEPLVEAGAGCFVLVRTSNPGAAEIQDEPHDSPLHERLAKLVDELGASAVGESGLSDVGAVTGATRPDLLQKLRDLMPRAIFLLPGVGAQGGSAQDLGPAFANHPAGGLISASRSIVGAHTQRGGDPARAAAAAAEELRRAAWQAR
ncbi:MAG: orotidine-5-phosphate decarboxylase [Thermoleophilaceae bacterium]|nr:orotidine-5-phosphate decarboxylase [Thermoleophilaceae bacterium]MEA2469876.1 orotidine-5-phosphate decarboxylase [Thermoleophilaceae bacterium]